MTLNRRRCGCANDCHENDDDVADFPAWVQQQSCCEHCSAGSSCVYEADFGCWVAHGGHCVAAAKIYLKKACLHGCSWFAPREDRFAAAGACVGHWDGDFAWTPTGIDDPGVVRLSEIEASCALSLEVPPAVAEILHSWELNLLPGGAAELVYDSPVGMIRYECEAFECLACSNFYPDAATAAAWPHFPKVVVVRPKDGQSAGDAPLRICHTPEDMCASGDPNVCSAEFNGVIECPSGDVEFTIPLTRYTAASPAEGVGVCTVGEPPAMPAGSMPSVASCPCGIWRGTSGDWEMAYWFDGTTYHVLLTYEGDIVFDDDVDHETFCRGFGLSIEFDTSFYECPEPPPYTCGDTPCIEITASNFTDPCFTFLNGTYTLTLDSSPLSTGPCEWNYVGAGPTFIRWRSRWQDGTGWSFQLLSATSACNGGETVFMSSPRIVDSDPPTFTGFTVGQVVNKIPSGSDVGTISVKAIGC